MTGRPKQSHKKKNPPKPTTDILTIYRTLLKTYGPQHWWPGDTPLEVIVGAVLTQNTAWGNVEKAIRELKNRKLLNMRRLSEIPAGRLAIHIKSSGFFNIKAKRLKALIGYLSDIHQGSLRRFFLLPAGKGRAELLGINGIGRETADSILLYAGQKRIFVVDAYTRRIFGRLGLLDGTADYDAIRNRFETDLPEDARLYNEYHALIVRHAKDHCRKRPRCLKCPIAAVCPAGRKQTNSKEPAHAV